MTSLSSGMIVGGLSMAAALSIAFHEPALGVFFSDPATAATLTALLSGVSALIGGFMKGLKG
jgi:hypothetical protein